MVKGCGNSCMKFILFAFNFVFVVIGVTLVTMGTYLLVKSKDFDKIVETPDAAAILVIIVGSVTFLIAFLGCCGASQESSCMLTTYAIVVGLVFLLEIAGAILLLVYTGQITDIARDGVRQAVNKYDPTQVNPPAPINGFVDILQWSLKCCGSEGHSDYYTGRSAKFPNGQVPQSCCYDPLETGRPMSTCGYQTSGGGFTMPFDQGCSKALDDFLRLFVGVIAGILIFAAAIKIIAACFACSLRNAVL